MNTLVFHAENLAVTEYSPTFTGLSPNYAVLNGKLCKVDGTADDLTAIVPLVEFGFAPGPEGHMQRPRYAYILGEGGNALSAYVQLPNGTRYSYTTPQRTGLSTRFVFGAGLRDNYLQLGITGDASMTIDQLSFEAAAAAQRRI